jgi:hypothetical protein
MKCPGQDTRYWKPGAVFEVKCPECGEAVEFFQDDTTRICKKCSHKFLNPEMDFGCASYCRYAEQCIGDLPPELIAQQENLLKDRVAIEVKRYFHRDFHRIGRAMRRARYAEQLGKGSQGNLAVIIMAAYLWDTVDSAAKKAGSGDLDQDETETCQVPRSILTQLGAREEIIREVCSIISHRHQDGDGENINFQIAHDAHQLAHLENRLKDHGESTDDLQIKMDEAFLTAQGKKMAEEMLQKT